MADRLDQVRLAEAGAAVDEERVERSGRIVGDRLGGRAGELIRFRHDERVEPVAGIEDGRRNLFSRWRTRRAEVVETVVGVDDEVDLEAFGGDLVQRGADLAAVAFADFVDVALRWNGHVERIPFLGNETSRGKPGVIVRSFNDLLDTSENLLPDVHREGPYVVENPQLFHTCGNSGCRIGSSSIASSRSDLQSDFAYLWSARKRLEFPHSHPGLTGFGAVTILKIGRASCRERV